MANVIHLLPDAVANQIAAGEVVQRPASVIKELTENSIDAGATNIKVVVRDAGRSLIQVTDNGCGMSEYDARLAFERHATSKISQAIDLYSLQTMGFRGEALAAIAAAAQVELFTRKADSELGVHIEIAGSKVTKQEPIATNVGSQFCVKNLFYNLPVRRRFMKSDTVEMRYINTEFLRVALAHPDISISLTSNSAPVYNFIGGNIKQRVAAVAGKALSDKLLPVEAETSLVKISGFVGMPETARKGSADQYFFINNRFMKHPYLQKAIVDAYKNLIPENLTPAFYIYFTIDPQQVDVNNDPQKIDVKLENEAAIWPILNAAVRECLGKYNVMPSFDFDTDSSIVIPTYTEHKNPADAMSYNPFEREKEEQWIPEDDDEVKPTRTSFGGGGFSGGGSSFSGGGLLKSKIGGWEQLYPSRMNTPAEQPQTIQSEHNSNDVQLFSAEDLANLAEDAVFIQFKGRYIVTNTPVGLIFIDQHRAHERVLFNTLENGLKVSTFPSQRLMFPEKVTIGAEDACVIEEMSAELARVGLEVQYEAEAGLLSVSSIPAIMQHSDVHIIIRTFLYDYKNGELDVQKDLMNYVMRTMAAQSALPYGRQMSQAEMKSLYTKLFEGDSPQLTPNGKRVYNILNVNDISAMF
ncbi:MAG: DNA mismatch repair endonuclease MutL [Bacteroidales bacterium]|nr:DNA mismatch repair endonuclease MutL [Bacteroidales bacterium]